MMAQTLELKLRSLEHIFNVNTASAKHRRILHTGGPVKLKFLKAPTKFYRTNFQIFLRDLFKSIETYKLKSKNLYYTPLKLQFDSYSFTGVGGTNFTGKTTKFWHLIT